MLAQFNPSWLIPSTPSPRQAAFSAFCFGSLRSLCLRLSSGGCGGAPVIVCAFSSQPAALNFALRWGCVAVPHPLGCSVSIPVHLRSSRWPVGAGLVISWSGGLRGFVRALARAGLVKGV